MHVNWESPTTEVLLNPRLSPAARRRLEPILAHLPPLRGHVWLLTSGSGSGPRLVALAKEAMLYGAAAVNAHLEVTPADRWLHALPLFHVGGLAILARAHLSGSAVLLDHDPDGMPRRWDAEAYVRRGRRTGATLSALVPAQVHDLVAAGLSPPPQLRAVVVGGGPLPSPLYREARALGWPLLPSYGATECASQVATASLASLANDEPPPLALLPHMEARSLADGTLAFRSGALLTGYAQREGEHVRLVDPKVEGWWRSEDLGEVRGRTLQVAGRRDGVVKIGGEQVCLTEAEALLGWVRRRLGLQADAALVARSDPRLGAVLHLVVAGTAPQAEKLLRALADVLPPFARPRTWELVPSVPRTALGKVARGELEALLGGGGG